MKHLPFFLFLSLFCSIQLNAQLNADFTANRISGCSPLIVQFTDLSTPPGSIVFRKWIFGNGNFSSAQNPQASYGDPGAYDVTLIISDGVDFDTIIKHDFITVFHDPLPDFTTLSPNSGCKPLQVDFKDSTQQADGAIIFWEWDFGDGITNNDTNPVHTYPLAGTYPVSLHVIDVNGCGNAKLYLNYIHVSETPFPAFSANATHDCSVPFQVNFSNTSTGNGTLTYQWDFGDSATSETANPAHTYTDFGSYNVELIVTDGSGCKDTLVKNNYIQIVSVTAGFTANNIVCAGIPLHFNNTSVGGNTNNWDFGDGNHSAAISPDHTYSNPGTYIVSLVSSVSGDTCASTFIDTITVEGVIANFSRNPWYVCEVPATVQFTDQSVNAVSWNWHFGNHISSTLQNPVNIYSNSGKFLDTLFVTSLHGCKDTLVDSVVIILPNPDYVTTINNQIYNTKGCAPLTVFFTDKSQYVSPYDSIVNWNWNFDDGFISNLQNPVHVFQNSGVYSVALTITTALGCDATYKDSIFAGEKPVVNFSVNNDTVCASSPVLFTDLSQDSTKNNEWSWIFNDSLYSHFKNPVLYFKDTGYMDLRFIVGYNGCYDTLIQDSVVYILGPVSRMKTQFTCDQPMLYHFTGNIVDANRWYWNFGDGAIDSVSANPSHTYTTSGDYMVRLRSYNDINGCPYFDSVKVYVRDPIAAFDADTTIGCPGLRVRFDGSPSQDQTVFFYYKFGVYRWNFDDNSVFQPFSLSDTITMDSISHVFQNKGTFHVKLYIQDINGCKDSVYKTIKVYQPETAFTADNPVGCVPLYVNFSDQTIADTLLSQWNWSLGNSVYSGSQDTSNSYFHPGNFSISLKVTDTLGCSKQLVKTNYISAKQTIPKFNVLDSTLCFNDSVHFINNTVGDSLAFLWNFGDGNTSSLKNPVYLYADSGLFTISLTVTDSVGCDSIVTKNNYVKIQAIPVANFYADTLAADCYPLLVQFTDSTASSYINQWNWNFGDGATSVISGPQHIYTRPGTYNVRLITTTSFGCKDTVTKSNYIDVKGPYAEFSISGDVACKGSPVMLKVDTMIDVYSFSWDFGDGSPIVPGNIDSVYHTYTNVGKLYPQLIYGDTANQCPKFERDSVIINLVIANFLVADTVSCAQTGINFLNQSFGESHWLWNFDDGYSSSLPEPQHIFNSAGTYDVKLVVSDDFTCKDSIIRTVVVNPLPQLGALDDTLICSGDTIYLKITGGYHAYLWSTGCTDSIAAITVSGIVTVKVQNDVGCWTKPDTALVTGVPFPSPHLGADTVICEATTITLIPGGSIWDSFLWQDSSSFQTFIADTAGTYYVRTSNLCGQASDTIHISQRFLAVVHLGADTVLCEGTNIILDAGSGYSYHWQDNSINQTLNITDGGIYSVTVTNICSYARDTINISLIPLPSVNLGLDTVLCENTGIILNAAGSIYDNYLWQDNSTDSVFTIDTAGIYYVRVSNICDQSFDTIYISEIYLPVVYLGADTAICEGTSIILNAGSGYDVYLWQNGDTATTFIADSAGAYHVLVSNSCASAGDTINVNSIPLPSVNLGADTVLCENTNITLNAAGSIYDNYLWQDNSTDSVFTADTAGIYYVRVSNICNYASDTIHISEIYLPVVHLGADTAICEGANITLNAGIGYDTYLWQNGDTTQFLTTDTAGAFHVNVINICSSAGDTIVISLIPQATVNIGADTAICENSTLELTAYGSIYDSYLWQDASSDSIFTVDTAGAYYVRVSNRCSEASDTIQITEILLPSVYLGKDTIICADTSITLNAGIGFSSYHWQNGDTTQMINTSTDTLYSVRVTNICGLSTDSIKLGFLPVKVFLNNDTAICEKTSVTLFATPGFDTYLWQNGDTGIIFTTDSAGLYHVIASNICGYVGDSMIVSIKPLPVLHLGSDTAISLGTLTLDAGNSGSTYLWSDGSTNQALTISSGPTVIWVQVTKNGCTSTDTIHILDHLPGGECTVELPTAFSPNGDGKNDVLYIRGYCVDKATLMIFNRFGQLVFESNDKNTGWDGTYKGEMQEAEVYVYYLWAKLSDGKNVIKKGNITLLH
ncbi:MAG: PKD domain-containing protein [Bacteroidia bacterium]|nr:PKD domain-containing protein [Bacteroidia bacterium]